MKGKVKEIILGSFVADTYCLGAHWVYMQMQLEKADLNWDGLKPPYTHRLKDYATKGFGCQLDTFDAIREFGAACDTEEGFPGVIYLLNKYGNDYKTIIQENAKAGGDSSARAILISMLLVAAYGKEIIPQQWINEMNYKL